MDACGIAAEMNSIENTMPSSHRCMAQRARMRFTVPFSTTVRKKKNTAPLGNEAAVI
jgi:hypothetical protein